MSTILNVSLELFILLLVFVSEMRMFHSYTQFLLSEVFRLDKKKKHSKNINGVSTDDKFCTRCKQKVTETELVICINCNRSVFCSRECFNLNRRVHEVICKKFFAKYDEIMYVRNELQDNLMRYMQEKTRNVKIDKIDNNIFNSG